MKVIFDLIECRNFLQQLREQGERIAFVPTMGNLHQGHLSLVAKAKTLADRVVVSIIVNPLQFGPNEDFSTYPRTMKEDIEKLENMAVDLVFSPSEEVLFPYGRDAQTRVTVPFITSELCGASRPDFFCGIATAVTKYFNLIQPDITVFGQKDFQQCLVIKQLILDFNFPIEFVMEPTVRESDGLAMSSRNQYLNAQERAIATELYQRLQYIVQALKQLSPEENFPQQAHSLCQDARFKLEKLGFAVDYLTVRHQQTLSLPSVNDSPSDCLVLGADMLGKTRLIDNVVITG